MKTLIVLVVMVWGLAVMAEPALAQCWTETTFLPDGRTVFCQVCNNGGQITRTCF